MDTQAAGPSVGKESAVVNDAEYTAMLSNYSHTVTHQVSTNIQVFKNEMHLY